MHTRVVPALDRAITRGDRQEPTRSPTTTETHSPALGAEVGGSAPSKDVRHAYLDQVVVGYVMYLVGAVTAFLAVALSLSDAWAGLHSSALAIGIVAAGLGTDRLGQSLGMKSVHVGALVLVGVAAALLVWAPALWATLAGACGCGLGAGVLIGHTSQTVSAGGGAVARRRMARATLAAMAASVAVPPVIGIGVAVGLGWRFAVVPVLALVGFALVATTRSLTDRPKVTSPPSGRLPSSYWLPWFLVVLVTAAEFTIAFWGGTLVRLQTGVTLAEGTLTISAFIAGAISGRLGLSTDAAAARNPISLLRSGTVLALGCSIIVWSSTSIGVSAVGMFGGGVALGMLYPLAASITMASAPEEPAAAAARLILAMGLAILVAPFVLGIAANLVGVSAAWLLIPAMFVGTLGLSLPVGRRQSRSMDDYGPGKAMP